MAFTKPVWNAICDLWQGGSPPNAGGPDIINVPCQKYVNSRLFLDITPGVWSEWVPPVLIRFDLDSAGMPAPYINLAANWVECPAGSGAYYRVRWGEVVHEGFPNAYGVFVVEQVYNDGTVYVPGTATSTYPTYPYY